MLQQLMLLFWRQCFDGLFDFSERTHADTMHGPPQSVNVVDIFSTWFLGVAWQLLWMSERIVINPDICSGKPIIRGTRITVQTVLEFLTAGDAVEDVLEEYPSLTREDVRACLESVSG